MHARLLSVALFLAFGVAAVSAYLWLRPPAVGIAAFLLIGVLGLWLAGRVFDRLATPEERRADLEDRVRNPDL
ncbi:MAG: hypothetical protein JNL61_14790 [Rhizobiaceae bacterium]|nr:hypothetical protein [Rhizobiaceae bacterium]